ncbi:Uncharacterised protein [Porphyromonas macacae]|uniref:Uncharacterized protein n=1 Tax=Porphyromonas macacae TaxID=28115 RepID=A0A379DHP0_9PORP|nr:Uncharacterised protein [Porphyromonas macacae]
MRPFILYKEKPPTKDKNVLLISNFPSFITNLKADNEGKKHKKRKPCFFTGHIIWSYLDGVVIE